MSELLTTRDVCQWLRCDRRSLYRFIKRDQMPHYRVGAGYRFTRADVEAWMKARAERGAA
jgi:excisionase family DNA binding protein